MCYFSNNRLSNRIFATFKLFLSTTMPKSKPQAANAKDTEHCSQDEQTAPLTITTLADQLNILKADICGKIESVVGSLRTEISSVREEFTSTTSALQTTVDSHANRLTEVENSAVFCGDSVHDLRNAVATLTREVSSLKNKCEDLESRSRRNNVRVIGLKEGAEGSYAAGWLAKWLHDTLGLDFEPAIDRAHRALRRQQSEAPRAMVIRLLYQKDRAVLLSKAREMGDSLQYDGKRVHLFPDLTNAQLKKREEFADVKRKLRGNSAVKDYGCGYSGHLRITLLDGKQHKFETPTEAEHFIRLHGLAQETAEPNDDVASNNHVEMD